MYNEQLLTLNSCKHEMDFKYIQ